VSEPFDFRGDGRGELPEDALSAYLDGELDHEARAAVEARLAGSAEWRGILDEVRAARDLVRALPVVEPPEDFLARLLAEADPFTLDPALATAPPPPPPTTPAVSPAGVVDLDDARARRSSRRGRWVAALGGAAAAAVVAAVLITPTPDRVKPAVASLTNAHAVRTSAGDDSVSSLASVGKVTGFRR
jgi:anti-sigma factor RsiW